ncbi:hypothetical protein MNBD_GAMMA08-1002 [hydrothermal vent metagenome]|uniref:Uncharacterized protein n=1 Tax=hydrothermal vent metagenome TaxID=652676 RepID=A0A3B0XRP5_9ZZZZ
MRMLDVEKKQSVWNLQLYLTEAEAKELYSELGKLLADPEANEHFHVFSEDSGRELSCSIVTRKKMKNISAYSKLERKVLMDK